MPIPDLLTRATHFFLLAGQVSLLGDWSRWAFWQVSTPPVHDLPAYLPALAAAVRKERNNDVLGELARHPLPDVLPQEALGWYESLVAAWEVHRTSSDVVQRNLARWALVRLDGCGLPDGMQRPSRLPEWLAEARQIVGAGYEPARTEPARTEPARTGATGWLPVPGGRPLARTKTMETLAALAAWRTAPGVLTAPEVLWDWAAFWEEVRRSRSPLIKGIAARALLNLPEVDLRAASLRPVPPEQLLHELATAIPTAAERTTRSQDYNYLSLLDWQPARGTAWPEAGVAEVIRVWLNVARHSVWKCRKAAWQQIINWDQTESLVIWGINLLPCLVSAVRGEPGGDVLWELTKATPGGNAFTGMRAGADPTLFSELEVHWQRKRQSGYWLEQAAGWLSGIRLHQARLAAEPLESFREACLSAVAEESDRDILFILAQWAPEPDAAHAVYRKWKRIWQHRLKDWYGTYRDVAGFAVLRQALKQTVERGTGDGLRRTALEVWRSGTEGTNEVRHLPGSLACRFYGIRAQLVAGRVPDFEVGSTAPAERHCPRLALPPGHIAGGEWRIENEKWKMENPEGVLKPVDRLAPDGPSR